MKENPSDPPTGKGGQKIEGSRVLGKEAAHIKLKDHVRLVHSSDELSSSASLSRGEPTKTVSLPSEGICRQQQKAPTSAAEYLALVDAARDFYSFDDAGIASTGVTVG